MKTSYVVISMGCCALISLNLFIISLLAPGWLVYSNFNDIDLELHMGLFYFNECTNMRKYCASHFYGDFPEVVNTKGRFTTTGELTSVFGTDKVYEEYLAEMLVAIIIMMFAVCAVFFYSRTSNPAYMTLPVILLLIPGILVWIATGRWIQLEYFVMGDMGIPYSLILNGIGATLCFIIIIILLVVMCFDWQRYNGNDRRVLVGRKQDSIANPQYVYNQPTTQPQLVYY